VRGEVVRPSPMFFATGGRPGGRGWEGHKTLLNLHETFRASGGSGGGKSGTASLGKFEMILKNPNYQKGFSQPESVSNGEGMTKIECNIEGKQGASQEKNDSGSSLGGEIINKKGSVKGLNV